MNFIEDLKEISKSFLDSFGIDYDKTLSTEEIIKIYVNVQNRLIKPQPRKVLQSTKLSNSSLDNHTKKVLDEIERKSKNGEDLNPHLSKGLLQGDYTDFLFADWKIYHLHLNTNIVGKYFVKRSDDILFAWVDDRHIYFIDVVPHKETHVFENTELLEIINEDWPHLIKNHLFKGKVEKVLTKDEIREFRRAGVLVATQLNNNEYILPLGGGLTTANAPKNISISVKQGYDKLIEIVQIIQKNVEKNRQEIDAHLSVHPQYDSKNTNFKLTVINNTLCLLEINSKIYFDIAYE